MQGELTQALLKLVKESSPGKKLAKAAAADLIVAVETYIFTGETAELQAKHFYAAASGLGRLGRAPEQVNLVELQVEQGVAEAPFTDVVLGVHRDAFIRSQAPRSPFAPGSHWPHAVQDRGCRHR
jgi:hypothetical protein